MTIAGSPITVHVIARCHVDAKADDIAELHSVFGQNRRDFREADIGLRFAAFWDDVVGSDAELPRGDDEPVIRRDGEPVTVPSQGRAYRRRVQRSHGSRQSLK